MLDQHTGKGYARELLKEGFDICDFTKSVVYVFNYPESPNQTSAHRTIHVFEL